MRANKDNRYSKENSAPRGCHFGGSPTADVLKDSEL